MEKKIVYFKLMQIVLTLAFILRLRSLHQFCGTFSDPKAFIHDISLGHCKRFAFIGKDSKSGEFGAVFDQDKWHNQLFMMNSTNGRPTEEQQHQFMDELAAKLPPAGRHCIPISIWPFNWIRLYKNQLNNGTLFYFSLLFWHALLSLAVLGLGIRQMRRSVEEYKFWSYAHAFYSVFSWCFCAEHSSTLELNWTDFWTCFNFRADHTDVPFVTLVLSIVMACLSIFEIFFKNLLFKKRPRVLQRC